VWTSIHRVVAVPAAPVAALQVLLGAGQQVGQQLDDAAVPLACGGGGEVLLLQHQVPAHVVAEDVGAVVRVQRNRRHEHLVADVGVVDQAGLVPLP